MKRTKANERLIAGARPTGALHIGHYWGMFHAFVRESHKGNTEAFFVIADLHMLTTNARSESTSRVPDYIKDLVVDCISTGVDPERCAFYVQSDILEQAQVFAIIQSLVPYLPLIKQPSFTAMSGTNKDAASLGLLAYPVLECADVIGIGATQVAVGEHNVHHLRLAQYIVDILRAEWSIQLPRPIEFTSSAGNVVGLDGGAKMSKSLKNTVHLRATSKEVEEAVSRMAITDSEGRCVPARLLSSFGESETAIKMELLFQNGKLSPDDARNHVFHSIERILGPMRKRREALLENQNLDIRELLTTGAEKARKLTASVLETLRTHLCLGHGHS